MKVESSGYFKNSLPVIKNQLLEPVKGDDLDFYISMFREKFGDHLLAILHYGSFLSEVTRKKDSFRDFFLIVDSYFELDIPPLHKMLSVFLPPNLYYFDEVVNGIRYVCKYNVISLHDFKTYTSFYPPDNYILGRFSKRMALLYYRDEEILNEIVEGMARSAFFTGMNSIYLLPRPLSIEEWIVLSLSFSYMAEERIEDFSVKSRELYMAASDYYNTLYGEHVFGYLVSEGIVRLDNGTGLIFYQIPPEEIEKKRKSVADYLKQSRLRTKARWPKMMITVDKWVDQLLWKLERVHGIKLEIPPWERKIILITGWRHYFRLKKKGKVH